MRLFLYLQTLRQPGRPPIAPLAVLLLCASLLAGCSAGSATSERPSEREAITYQSMRDAGVTTNAYDAVARLRPGWLRSRGPTSLGGAQYGIPVYVNNQRHSRQAAGLRDISVEMVERIERLTAAQAHTRFGAGHPRGAFVVTVR